MLLSDRRFRDELARVHALLAPYGPVRWFRPGSGWFTPRMLRSAAPQELGAVLGTLVAIHRGGPGDEQIARSLAGAVRPGSIVVLHEGTVRRRGVVATTDQMLAQLRRRRLTPVAVSGLAHATGKPGRAAPNARSCVGEPYRTGSPATVVES